MAQAVTAPEIIDNFKKIVTTQYICFDGRMSKRDFWLYMIPTLIASCIPFVGQLLALALLLPTLGATARRLHDVGKTGWLQLIGLICPPIGSIVVLVMCIPDGEAGANKYGEAPAAPAAAE
jgi:uncharacterized membrane protein YhaH (DUF805 family)